MLRRSPRCSSSKTICAFDLPLIPCCRPLIEQTTPISTLGSCFHKPCRRVGELASDILCFSNAARIATYPRARSWKHGSTVFPGQPTQSATHSVPVDVLTIWHFFRECVRIILVGVEQPAIETCVR